MNTINLFDTMFNKAFFDMVGGDCFHSIPQANVYESGDSFNIDVAIPGYTKSDFEIKTEDYKIIVALKKADVNKKHIRKEFDYANSKRVFTIPAEVDANSFNAKYESGVLSLKAKYLQTSEPKNFNIDIV